jgi:membrane protease YdiL (CAAX protease family)
VSSGGPPEAVRNPEARRPPSRPFPVPIPRPRTEQQPDPPPGDRASFRWGFGAYLLAEAVFLVSSLALMAPWVGRGAGLPAWVLLATLTVPTLLSAGVALAATWLRGNGPARDLGLWFRRADLLTGLRFGGLGLVITLPAGAVWSAIVGPTRANSAVGELFAGQRPAVPLAVAVFLVVWLVAPVCEEIVYRGLLWGALRRHGANRWWTFGLTTLLFALAHFEFTRTPLLLVIAVPIGLARLVTDRLGASIVAHQVNNALPAVALLLTLLGVLG